jgi:organic hydroperoxide reductase OsmC/OhrA
MQDLPHRYSASGTVNEDGDILLGHPGCPWIASDAPREFDGPGDRWSPETLLVAATVSCFGLTFRGLARKHKLRWHALECHATGLLDRVDGVLQFTSIALHATLDLPLAGDGMRAERLLHRAEETCLIANSLKAARRLDVDIRTDALSAA